ncbi:MAG: NUDIX domain-containing protein [Candidatus Heimdallarchaeaceae archaeon]
MSKKTNLQIVEKIDSNNTTEDRTIKYLFQTQNKEFFEAVLIFEDTLTLCTSCQIGCPVKCVFCRTGQDKFVRNLTADEIVEQVRLIEKDIKRKIQVVSYMGMGEPLLNLDNVIESMKRLKRKYKLSTIGIPGKITQLMKTDIPIQLYFSLHSPTETERRCLIPFSKTYDLDKVIEEINQFSKKKGSIIIWYLLLSGQTDTNKDADNLIKTLRKFDNIKLVYLKEYCETGTGCKKSTRERMNFFASILSENNIPYKISISEGQKIKAGCGQLRQHYEEKLKPMKKQLVVSGYVLDREGENLLLIKRTKPPWKDYWLVPGGHVEDIEFPHEALVREIKEETGIEAEVLDLHDNEMKKYGLIEPGIERLPQPFVIQRETSGHKDHEHLNFVYVCKAVDNGIEKGEDMPVKWMNAEEIKNIKMPKDAKIWALKIMSRFGNGYSKNFQVSHGSLNRSGNCPINS